jgi:hypothetical protein
MLFKGQILNAIRKAATKLGRAPSRAEFLRMSKITEGKLLSHFSGYREAVRAAGLEPKRQFERVDTWTLVEDWARVARLCGHLPSLPEYLREGRHGHSTLISRLGRWTEFGVRFTELVEQYGRQGEFADVLEMARHHPLKVHAAIPGRPRKPAAGAVITEAAKQEASQRMDLAVPPAASPTVLPPQLQGKKCVTASMLPVFLAAVLGAARQNPHLAALGAIRTYPDRPVMGAPLRPQPRNIGAFGDPGFSPQPRNIGAFGDPGFSPQPRNIGAFGDPDFMLEGLANEPLNEMGVMCLFAVLARRLGFVIEMVRSQFPDCEARFEVEPGRWQRVRIEFEFESLGFHRHRHDPKGCDIIVCWRHNWPDCPKNLVVIELSRIV